MSTTTRKKKAAKAAVRARRMDALDRLLGRGLSDEDLVERVRFLVNTAWQKLLYAGLYDLLCSCGGFWLLLIWGHHGVPYMSLRDGGRMKLRPTWEHLRSALPNYNERKTWGRKDKATYALLILAEKARREVAKEARNEPAKPSWALERWRSLQPYEFNVQTPGVAEALRGE